MHTKRRVVKGYKRFIMASHYDNLLQVPKLVKFAGLGRFWCCEANLRSGGPSPPTRKSLIVG